MHSAPGPNCILLPGIRRNPFAAGRVTDKGQRSGQVEGFDLLLTHWKAIYLHVPWL